MAEQTNFAVGGGGGEGHCYVSLSPTNPSVVDCSEEYGGGVAGDWLLPVASPTIGLSVAPDGNSIRHLLAFPDGFIAGYLFDWLVIHPCVVDSAA